MTHPSRIAEAIVRKVVRRRGRLHAFESVDPRRTALVTIDLDATVGQDETCRAVVPRVNAVAEAVRRGAGVPAWVLSCMDVLSENFRAILGDELAQRYLDEMQAGGARSKLCPDIVVKENDVHAIKSGASAFFPANAICPRSWRLAESIRCSL